MNVIPDDVLNDVFSRFILPERKSSSDPIRLCFAIEVICIEVNFIYKLTAYVNMI